jgi:hypothetical protein
MAEQHPGSARGLAEGAAPSGERSIQDVLDARLDEALVESFPASDVTAVHSRDEPPANAVGAPGDVGRDA